MRIETFRQRLREGKGVSYCYERGDSIGGISVWRHENKFVVTWEECLRGDFYNEHKYTRDEVHRYDTIDDVLGFLGTNGIDPTLFTP